MTPTVSAIEAREEAAWTVRGELTTCEFAGWMAVGPQGSMAAVVRKDLADDLVRAVNDRDALLSQLRAYREALEKAAARFEAIQKATVEGRVCDDVAWFSDIETLHDYCATAADQARTLLLGAPMAHDDTPAEDICEKHHCPLVPAFGDWLTCPKCDAEERAELEKRNGTR